MNNDTYIYYDDGKVIDVCHKSENSCWYCHVNTYNDIPTLEEALEVSIKEKDPEVTARIKNMIAYLKRFMLPYDEEWFQEWFQEWF